VVVHRRKTDDLYKDTDDIRENIINYEDEGGGEGDMTGYDLNVLRLMYDNDGQPILNKEPVKAPLVGRGGECSEVPDPKHAKAFPPSIIKWQWEELRTLVKAKF